MNINNFQKNLKIKFKKRSLFIKALTHKSANQENNNEKLIHEDWNTLIKMRETAIAKCINYIK